MNKKKRICNKYKINNSNNLNNLVKNKKRRINKNKMKNRNRWYKFKEEEVREKRQN